MWWGVTWEHRRGLNCFHSRSAQTSSTNSEWAHLQRLSDDSAVIECTSGGWEEQYRALVRDFVERSGRNHLLLNVAETRETVIDFRKKSP